MNELTTLLGAAFLYMAIAMWATRPPDGCEMRVEPHRYLDLARDVDREHLGRDIAVIGRIARRYATNLGAENAIGPCRDILARQLAVTHDLTLDQVRAAIPRE